jgi:hypothetical protein
MGHEPVELLLRERLEEEGSAHFVDKLVHHTVLTSWSMPPGAAGDTIEPRTILHHDRDAPSLHRTLGSGN